MTAGPAPRSVPRSEQRAAQRSVQRAEPGADQQPARPPVLRPVRWWDLAEIAALETALFPDDPWSPEQLWSELARVPETRCYLAARDAAGITGYAGLYAVVPDADVQTIAVVPRARGTGLAAALLEALVAEARRRRCTRLLLEVRADNAPARRLYERSGFVGLARRSSYYGPGIDALVLARDLRAGRTPAARDTVGEAT